MSYHELPEKKLCGADAIVCVNIFMSSNRRALNLTLYLFMEPGALAQSLGFYVHELGLFVEERVFEDDCLLRPLNEGAYWIHLASYHARLPSRATFEIGVDNAHCYHKRLAASPLSSGARLVPDASGRCDLFEYPAGAWFQIEDPSGNHFMIVEDYTQTVW